MRKATILSLLAMVFVTSNAQWTDRSIFPSGVSYLDIFFVNENTGWVIGEEGIILHTIDRGANWNYQLSNTNKNLNEVTFLDPENGWIAGDEGIILRTNDGGVNWENISLPDTINLTSVAFRGSDEGWATGSTKGGRGVIVATADLGNSWSIRKVTELPLNKIVFHGGYTGWITGSKGLVLKTFDGGKKWIEGEIPYAIDLSAIFIIDSETGWCAGNGSEGIRVLRLDDNGSRWSPLGTYTGQADFRVKDVFFLNEQTGWMVGTTSNHYGAGGFLLFTRNGGRTWEEHFCGTPNRLTGIWFTGQDNGWIIGEKGTLLSTGNDYLSGFDLYAANPVVTLRQSPNPFKFNTAVDYELNNPSWINITIYDERGSLVEVLVDEYHLQGQYEVPWASSDLPPGIYFCVLKTYSQVTSTKMVKLD